MIFLFSNVRLQGKIRHASRHRLARDEARSADRQSGYIRQLRIDEERLRDALREVTHEQS